MKTKTETSIKALRIMERSIQTPDGVANTVFGDAANRLEELQEEVERLSVRVNALNEETGQWQSYFVHAVAKLSRSAEAGQEYREEAEQHYSNFVCTLQERDHLKAELDKLKGELFRYNCRDVDIISNFAREPSPNRAVRKAHAAKRCCDAD